MFAQSYQSGSNGVEIFTPSGPSPSPLLVDLTKTTKQYDRELKGYYYNIKNTSLTFPKDYKHINLGLFQPLFILQLLLDHNINTIFNLEISVTTNSDNNNRGGQRIRLYLSTNFNKLEYNQLHIQIPFIRDLNSIWCNYVIDVGAYIREIYGHTTTTINTSYNIEYFIIKTNQCYLRKIFTLPYPQNYVLSSPYTDLIIPYNFQFPIESSIIIMTPSQPDLNVPKKKDFTSLLSHHSENAAIGGGGGGGGGLYIEGSGFQKTNNSDQKKRPGYTVRPPTIKPPATTPNSRGTKPDNNKGISPRQPSPRLTSAARSVVSGDYDPAYINKSSILSATATQIGIHDGFESLPPAPLHRQGGQNYDPPPAPSLASLYNHTRSINATSNIPTLTAVPALTNEDSDEEINYTGSHNNDPHTSLPVTSPTSTFLPSSSPYQQVSEPASTPIHMTDMSSQPPPTLPLPVSVAENDNNSNDNNNNNNQFLRRGSSSHIQNRNIIPASTSAYVSDQTDSQSLLRQSQLQQQQQRRSVVLPVPTNDSVYNITSGSNNNSSSTDNSGRDILLSSVTRARHDEDSNNQVIPHTSSRSTQGHNSDPSADHSSIFRVAPHSSQKGRADNKRDNYNSTVHTYEMCHNSDLLLCVSRLESEAQLMQCIADTECILQHATTAFLLEYGHLPGTEDGNLGFRAII